MVAPIIITRTAKETDDAITVLEDLTLLPSGDVHFMGDSLVAGYGGATPISDAFASKTGRTVVNRAVVGDRVKQIVEGQLLDTVGSFTFNFRSSTYPFDMTDVTATIDADRMLLTKDSTATFSYAACELMTVGEEYTVTGSWAGDGTAYPVLIDNGTGIIVTGSTSTSEADFSLTFTAANTKFRFQIQGGTTGSFIYIHGMTITKTDQSACAPGDIICNGGSNDIAYSIAAETTQDGYKMIIDACYQNKKRLIFLLCPPWNNNTSQKTLYFALNDWLVKNVKTPLVDPTELGDWDYYHLTAYSLDGLHFNTVGNAAWADLIIEQIYTTGYSGSTYRSLTDW